MKIAVIYDAAADGRPTPDTSGVLEAVDGVVDALGRLGHDAFPVPAARPFGPLLARLETVDLIFNLVESLDARAEDEPRVAALLELAGPPVTGAPSETLALCRRKDRVNALLASRGLPVPSWSLASELETNGWTEFPAIVKPVGEDGSVGIHERSVVEDAPELRTALERMAGAAVVQRFVGGRELAVGFVGDAALPVAEIEFAGAQRVVSYASKWEAGSVADLATRAVCPARIPEAVRRQAMDLGQAAWRLVGGRGYGRVDLREDDGGRLHLLEVNPNPDLAPAAGLARMAAAAGWDYPTLVRRVVREARS